MHLATPSSTLKPRAGRLLAAAVLLLSAWIVHGFLEAITAACVIAVATWPLYARSRRHVPPRLGRGLAAATFTIAIAVFVLAPLVFACAALVDEIRSVLLGLAGAGVRGIAAPAWLSTLAASPSGWPVQAGTPHPDGLALLARHATPATMLGWAQSLAAFALQQALMIGFAILLLFFFYRQGDRLTREMTRLLARSLGASAPRYLEVATQAVRASVNSMLVVGLFDAAAAAVAYSVAGTPRALVWAAITGSMAAVPFLGYAAVGAMALMLAMKGLQATALMSLVLGTVVLLCGDKIVRPMVARGGIRLPFVWVLMGCIGGFGAFGLSGLVTGPALLAVAKEMLEQWLARRR